MPDLVNHSISRKQDDASFLTWLYGYLSVWIGLLATMAIMLLFLLIVVVLVGLGIMSGIALGYESPDDQFIIVMLLALPLSIPWIWICVRFFFPCFFGIVDLSGMFFQRLAWVKPKDTLGVVRGNLDLVQADLRRLWRYVVGGN